MRKEYKTTRSELWRLSFFGCLIFGAGLIIITVNALVFDQPTERMEEIQNDWPVVLVSSFLIAIGWIGGRFFKRKVEDSNDEENKGPQ